MAVEAPPGVTKEMMDMMLFTESASSSAPILTSCAQAIQSETITTITHLFNKLQLCINENRPFAFLPPEQEVA